MPVVVHSSWRGIIAGYLSVALLITLAVLAIFGGVAVIIVVLTAFAIVLTVVVVFDYPIASEFGPGGVVRRCLGRRETLAWDRIEALTRSSDAISLDPGEGRKRFGVTRRPTGLVAVVGRRRYLLVNQCESPDESRMIRDNLFDWAPGTVWVAGVPPEDQPPTWLYRRRRHRPSNG